MHIGFRSSVEGMVTQSGVATTLRTGGTLLCVAEIKPNLGHSPSLSEAGAGSNRTLKQKPQRSAAGWLNHGFS